jgi:hypothetical protein
MAAGGELVRCDRERRAPPRPRRQHGAAAGRYGGRREARRTVPRPRRRRSRCARPVVHGRSPRPPGSGCSPVTPPSAPHHP